jgi:hypothetical protein
MNAKTQYVPFPERQPGTAKFDRHLDIPTFLRKEAN